MSDTLADFVEKLLKDHSCCECVVPSAERVQAFVHRLLRLLLPQFSERRFSSKEQIHGELSGLQVDLEQILKLVECRAASPLASVGSGFLEQLPNLSLQLKADAEAIYRGDPAAESLDEVIVAYPGFLAVAVYRVANYFCMAQVPLFPRTLSEYAHRLTGIDIHPGATIGESFCIDHGTGIVIGETSIIGKRVKIYQGVTLGALSVDKSQSKNKRHPTIEDGVVIYSNATILGGETVVGANSIIGGNSWLTESVPANSVVYRTSEIKVKSQSLDWSI